MPALTARTALLPPSVRTGPELPRLGADSTLALLREGYLFGTHGFERCGTDAFETRLMGRNAVVAYGEEAARAFYEPGRMTRRWALPISALSLLLDLGSVSMLDGADHRRRKEMFLSLMTPGSLQRLADGFEDELLARADRWRHAERVVLLDELHEVLCAAVCAWAGVPLTAEGLDRRTREFEAMIDGAGGAGPRNLRGQLRRRRTERWAGWVVEQVRAGALEVGVEEPVAVVAHHRGADGELLPVEVAAVELINLLRPTVAVARFLTFAALALHQHPEWREPVATDDARLHEFVQEVRRTTPFFPLVGGRALEEFEWRGRTVRPGAWMLLDLYATNHDARSWDDPWTFRPERFRDWDESPFTLVPQGGGDVLGHRCAGEWLTIELMKRGVRLLTASVRYAVPPQDLHVDLGRMPASPASRFVLSSVSRTPSAPV